MFIHAGRLLYLICSVKFQKRGLPHSHLLLKFHADCVIPQHIDSIVSAELPEDPMDRQLIQTYMMHHHVIDGPHYSKYCIKEDRAG